MQIKGCYRRRHPVHRWSRMPTRTAKANPEASTRILVRKFL